MSSETNSKIDIEKMTTPNLRSELRKRNINISGSTSRKEMINQLRDAMDKAANGVRCYSGTKCETGCLYWDIEWDAIECKVSYGPGHSIKSTNIKVGDYSWYAELFPKGELQKNNYNANGEIDNENQTTEDNNNNTDNSTNANNQSNNSSSAAAAPALFLSICKTTKPVQMRFTVQLWRDNKWSEAVISSLRVFVRHNHGWGWKEWMDYTDLKRDYESDSKLKLKITIDVYGPVETVIQNDKITFNLHSQLSNKMNELFQKALHSDVSIVVCGYTLYPEKCKKYNKHNNDSLDDAEDEEDEKENEDKLKLFMVSPPHKRRKLNNYHQSGMSNNNNGSSHFIRNNKSSTIEKRNVLGIDEDLMKDCNCRKKKNNFVSLSIPVHKCILSNFSPYFESMFSHQFKENVDGKIYIGKQRDDEHEHEHGQEEVEDAVDGVLDNVDPYVMKVLLEYMYTERIEHGIDRYLLLLLADRYQIERLVILCLQDLTNEMNVNNVTTILSISNKFNEKYSFANQVKSRCLEYICNNISFVMDTQEYKNACKIDKTLTHEILTAFGDKHKQDRNNSLTPQKRRFQI